MSLIYVRALVAVPEEFVIAVVVIAFAVVEIVIVVGT